MAPPPTGWGLSTDKDNSAMHVIYVHGVSERPDTYEFDKALRQRRQAFAHFVSKRLDRGIISFEAAGWGDLCPDLTRDRGGQRLGSGANMGFTPDPVRWQDFLTANGDLQAAPFVEAGLLRDASLTGDQLSEGMRFVDEISEANVVVAPPAPLETNEQIVTRIASARPQAAGRSAQSLDFGSSRVLNTLARSLELAVRPFGGRPRDVIATELASRWIDIVWYFGKGRAEVRARVLQRFSEITRKSPDVPVVILAHSLGGFIAHEAITSPAFVERGLADRGPWILFCLGSQLTIFEKIGLMDRGLKLSRDLAGRVRYRNIVDPNDPLGFKVNINEEPELDVAVTSGTNFLSAHGTYLDSSIVLAKIRTELRRLLRELNV
jgi:hypothetical protein